MKKYVLCLLASLMMSSAAHADEGNFPGSLWVNVTGPQLSGEERGNWILSGRATQDAVIVEVGNWNLNATTSVGFSRDTKGFEWNNKVVPSVGVRASYPTHNGVFDVTVQYAYEQRFGDLYRSNDRSNSGVQVSINYWTGWGR